MKIHPIEPDDISKVTLSRETIYSIWIGDNALNFSLDGLLELKHSIENRPTELERKEPASYYINKHKD